MAKSLYENIENAIYDPYVPKYFEIESLEKELERTFDLCNGCRMCFKYCPSFPSLFKAMDNVDADAKLLTAEDKTKVVEECFQCKICYVVCPYTEDEGHPFKIDFPSLMRRAKILAFGNKNLSYSKKSFKEKLFGNPDLLGMLSSGWKSIFVNRVMKNNFHRVLLQKLIGIHKNKLMPSFAYRTFKSWFKSRAKKIKS